MIVTMIVTMIPDDSGNDSDDDIDSDDDPTMTTSMLRSGVIAGDNGSPKLLTLGPAQPPELENTNFAGMYFDAFLDVLTGAPPPNLENIGCLYWLLIYQRDPEILQKSNCNTFICQL